MESFGELCLVRLYFREGKGRRFRQPDFLDITVGNYFSFLGAPSIIHNYVKSITPIMLPLL